MSGIRPNSVIQVQSSERHHLGISPPLQSRIERSSSQAGLFGKRMSSDRSPIRILIVDDHALLREGIAALVNAESDMKLVAEACNGQEAIEQFRSNRPDVTLMDLQMPALNGIDAIIGIRNEFPNARIIVLTTYTGDVQALRALKAGARGYILKGEVHRDLLDTIRAVHAGQKRIPPEVAAELAVHAAEDDLTSREIDVLRLIASGNANKEIAGQLCIAEDTVKSHVTNILAKLGANDRTHAVTIGLKRGIIEL
jgi:DNA-binding NarL/FixJ family response regulator